MANVTVSEKIAAGEEAIGILSFFVKAIVRIIPLLFGIGTIVGAIGVLLGLVPLLRVGNAGIGMTGLTMVILSACLPFASYVFFALYHLIIDILRAILVLPQKLDNLPK